MRRYWLDSWAFKSEKASMKTETNRSYFNCVQSNSESGIGPWLVLDNASVHTCHCHCHSSSLPHIVHKTIFKSWQNLPVVLRMFNPFQNQSLHQKHPHSRPRLPLWKMLLTSVKYNRKGMDIPHHILGHPHSRGL